MNSPLKGSRLLGSPRRLIFLCWGPCARPTPSLMNPQGIGHIAPDTSDAYSAKTRGQDLFPPLFYLIHPQRSCPAEKDRRSISLSQAWSAGPLRPRLHNYAGSPRRKDVIFKETLDRRRKLIFIEEKMR